MADSDSDIEIVDTAGFDAARDAPHARHDCLVHKMSDSSSSNAAFCPQCYCWVCDVPASQCAVWSNGCSGPDCRDSSSHMCSSHCHANPAVARWVTARAAAQRKRWPGEGRSLYFSPLLRARKNSKEEANPALSSSLHHVAKSAPYGQVGRWKNVDAVDHLCQLSCT